MLAAASTRPCGLSEAYSQARVSLELRLRLLRLYPAAEMECYPVSAVVNSPQNQGAELTEPLNVNAP
jgi:putative SOS response-associated peptidase YedK